MVGFDAHALLCKLLPPPHVLSRSEAGEGEEVTDHVRLIEVAALRRQRRPDGGSGAAQKPEGVLKSTDAGKELRPHTNFRGEDIDESPLAEAHLACDLARSRVRARLSQRTKGALHRRMVRLVTIEAGEQGLLEDPKAFPGGTGAGQPVLKPTRSRPPDVVETHMTGARLAG